MALLWYFADNTNFYGNGVPSVSNSILILLAQFVFIWAVRDPLQPFW